MPKMHKEEELTASTAPVVDNKLVSDLIEAVNRSKSINSDGEWWLDTLKAGGRVRALLAKAGQDESCKWRVALRMYQKTHADLVALRQRVEDTVIVAKTDVDEGGGITAYHFKTGAIHRLLAEARQGDGPESAESNYVRNAAATAAPVEHSDETLSANETHTDTISRQEAIKVAKLPCICRSTECAPTCYVGYLCGRIIGRLKELPAIDSAKSARAAAEEICKYLNAFTPLSPGEPLIRIFEDVIQRHCR